MSATTTTALERGLFIDGEVRALLAEGLGGGEPGVAAADDQELDLALRHL